MAPSIDPLTEKIQSSKNCIIQAIQKFGVDGCALSFNGGKDCTVLLDLLCQCWPKTGHTLLICYVAHLDSFTELEEFINQCMKKYQVRINRIVGDMKEAFSLFLRNHPQIKAIFIGVRRTDPFCSQLHDFDTTDNGWPEFTRCHPILDWSYADIWTYLIENRIPYCILYDKGYTSLGPRSSTVPNSNLRVANGTYRPAYMLQDENHERAGRLSAT